MEIMDIRKALLLIQIFQQIMQWSEYSLTKPNII